MVERSLIRIKQVKALYQRELTALNRNPSLDAEARHVQAERLWRQANEQIATLRHAVAKSLETMSDEQRSVFEPPKRPPYLDDPE